MSSACNYRQIDTVSSKNTNVEAYNDRILQKMKYGRQTGYDTKD
jgi:hypothetical protein